MKTTDAKAARALLAYFNHDLAKQLVARVLKEKSSTAWQTLADCILAMLPKAAGEKAWLQVVAWVDRQASAYIASAAFQTKAADYVRRACDGAVAQAMEQAAKERALVEVRKALQLSPDCDTRQLQGRLRELVSQELQRVAVARVAEVAGPKPAETPDRRAV